MAAGILAFGPHHGGDIESCMRFLDGGLTLVRGGRSVQEAAEALVDECLTSKAGAARLRPPVPHARSARRAAVPDGARARARRRARPDDPRHRAGARGATRTQFGRPLPVNVDGAIAAICADLGFAYELGNAIFLISRLPGLIAHAHEERTRQPPMRQIDPKDHDYDGSRERRLPEGRK